MFLMTVAMTRAGAPGRLLHAALAAPFWRPLAELSYSAYLYHEPVRRLCMHVTHPAASIM